MSKCIDTLGWIYFNLFGRGRLKCLIIESTDLFKIFLTVSANARLKYYTRANDNKLFFVNNYFINNSFYLTKLNNMIFNR